MASMLRLALLQIKVSSNKVVNLQNVASKVQQLCSSAQKPDLVCLPECFNTPYGHEYFAEYAEEIPVGETCRAMSKLANDQSVYIVAGSIPEKRGDKIYNTCVVFGKNGETLGKYSKMHLFDVDIPNQFKFIESDSLSAGGDLLDFSVGDFRIGIGICYDMRFPELASVYSNVRKCNVLIYPGAFSTTTGPAHWELLARSRALDNQCYVAVCSPAADPGASYVSHAHSMVVGPWGDVVCNADKEDNVAIAELSLAEISRVRQAIPISKQRRLDLYKQAELVPPPH